MSTDWSTPLFLVILVIIKTQTLKKAQITQNLCITHKTHFGLSVTPPPLGFVFLPLCNGLPTKKIWVSLR